MGPKNKVWIVVFQTYNKQHDAITGTQEVQAVSAAHARNVFIREHYDDGMTYRILDVTEAKK